MTGGIREKYKKIREGFARIPSIDGQIFFIDVICVTVIALCSMIVKRFILGFPMNAFLFVGGVVLATLLILFLGWKTGKYSFWYTVLCLLVNMAAIPYMFIITGGFRSGMPEYIVMGYLMCAFHFDEHARYYTAAASTVSYGLLFLAALRHPEKIIPLTEEQAHAEMIWGVLFITLVVVVIITIILDSYRRIYLRSRQDYEKKSQMHLALLESQVESIRDVNSQKHDMKHHNMIIREYAVRHDQEGLLNYLREKQYSDEFYARKIYCMNAVINNVLTVYAGIARKKEVAYEANAIVTSALSVEESDLVTLLSVPLENAVNAAAEEMVKKVRIDVRRKRSRLIIHCSYASVRSEDELFDTEEVEADQDRLEKILAKYSGIQHYSLKEGWAECQLILEAEDITAG